VPYRDRRARWRRTNYVGAGWCRTATAARALATNQLRWGWLVPYGDRRALGVVALLFAFMVGPPAGIIWAPGEAVGVGE